MRFGFHQESTTVHVIKCLHPAKEGYNDCLFLINICSEQIKNTLAEVARTLLKISLLDFTKYVAGHEKANELVLDNSPHGPGQDGRMVCGTVVLWIIQWPIFVEGDDSRVFLVNGKHPS